MNEKLTFAVKQALSFAGYQVSDEQAWEGPGISFTARRKQLGVSRATHVVCIQQDDTNLVEFTENIENHFASYLDSGKFSEVLIVFSGTELNYANSEMTVHRDPRLILRTLDQLLRDSIDFHPYLNSLATIFDDSADGLANYYVRPVDVAQLDIEDQVTRWLSNSNLIDETNEPFVLNANQPVAILGAYGIGKSSLATRLASRLAQEALTGQSSSRIPVLIRLGEVSGEQTLEGLLGKHFTATHQVNGYSFAAFDALNRRGHLVVILDGFDEMKQLLSWREFRYNLAQLNRLQVGDSRLIILGRPTAFETDAEHQYALHGVRHVGNRVRREPGWPDYQELEISPLTPRQITSLTEDYLRYLNSPLIADERRMSRLREQLTSRQLKDISRRPVQLRMLLEILPDYKGNIDDLDIRVVYEIFIEQLIAEIMEREEEKHSRLKFKAADRRQFLKEFAYWLWNNRDAGIATTDMIPDHIISHYAGQDDEIESVRRDLVVGSPLDRRHGERIRFPHRSFQEFLVAETIWEHLQAGDITLSSVDRLINPEVAEFMSLQRHQAQEALAQRLLPTLNTPIRLQTCTAIFLNDQVTSGLHQRLQELGRSQPLNDAELLMITLWTMKNPSSQFFAKMEDILKVQGPSLLYRFFCSTLISERSRRHDALIIELVDKIANNLMPPERITAQRVESAKTIILLNRDWIANTEHGRVNIGKLSGKARVRLDRQGKQYIEGGDNIGVRWMPELALSIFQKSNILKGGTVLDMRGLRPTLAAFFSRGAFISDWIRNETIDPTVIQFDKFEIPSGANIHTTFAEFNSIVERVAQLAEAKKLKSSSLSGISLSHENRLPERGV